MHAKFKIIYNLGDADAPFVDSLIPLARKAGVSEQQIEASFAKYCRDAHRFAAMDDEARDRWFGELVREVGLPEAAVDAWIDWTETIRATGTPPPPDRPAPEQDRKRLEEIQRTLKIDQDTYWNDPKLQAEHYEVIERLLPPAPALPAPNDPNEGDQ